jgi:rubrerythrin
MKNALKRALTSELERGGGAYIRDLAAAEQAVLQGQFNLAKILRAAAHSQRIIAMEAARLLEKEFDEKDLLNAILEEIGADKDVEVAKDVNPAIQKRLAQSADVRERLRNIVKRSLTSLESNSDVLESHVAQTLWGCYGCGAILEGEPPHSCPICGVLSIEFEGFWPFYSATAEHLGQLRPEEIIDILESIPAEVETFIKDVDIAVLQQKPSADEWSAAEIVGHMLETDIFFTKRARALLEAQGVELPWSMPPWKLHEGKGYETMQAAEIMTHMRAARTQSLDLLRALTPEDWVRKGLNFGSKTSMLDMGTWVANHDRGHLAQIKRLCEI